MALCSEWTTISTRHRLSLIPRRHHQLLFEVADVSLGCVEPLHGVLAAIITVLVDVWFFKQRVERILKEIRT
jgi:hypothetical protein